MAPSLRLGDEEVDKVEDIVEEGVVEVRIAGHVLSKGRQSQLRLVVVVLLRRRGFARSTRLQLV